MEARPTSSGAGATKTSPETERAVAKRPRLPDADAEAAGVQDLIGALLSRVKGLQAELAEAHRAKDDLLLRLGSAHQIVPLTEAKAAENRERAARDKAAPLPEKIQLLASREAILNLLNDMQGWFTLQSTAGGNIAVLLEGEKHDGPYGPTSELAQFAKTLVVPPEPKDEAVLLYGPHTGARVKVMGRIPAAEGMEASYMVRVLAGHKAAAPEGLEEEAVYAEWKKDDQKIVAADQLGLAA